MSFLDDFDFSSLGDLFSGGGAEGMTNDAPSVDLGGSGASVAPSAPTPDLGQFSLDSMGGIGGANPAFTPSGQPPGLSTSGYSPNAPATVGGTAPGQAQAAPSAPFGDEPGTGKSAVEADAPYHPANPAPGQPPPPTAWESVKNAPGKWWDTTSKAVGDEFAQHPIATTARVGAMAAPLIGAGIGAMTAPKAPGKYTVNPPRPASATAGSDVVPAASPMSTTLTGQGGFNVKSGQGLAEGGKVTSQDEADYQEAMRQSKGQQAPPAQPAPKPKSTYDQQLEDADKGKQPKSGYFKRN